MAQIPPFSPFPPFPPMVPVSGGGGGGFSLSLSDLGGRFLAVGLVVFLVVLASVCFSARKFARKLWNKNAPPPPSYVASEILLEADASTMENLFYEITKEKPVRFTSQQLCDFTNNYSTKFDYGGFGEVFKGEFPNGVNIVVKLLNDIINLHKKVELEKQFVVEVGSISRIYHINLVRLYGFCYEHCSSSNIIALVFEYMENGSLDKFLFDRRQQDIEWGKLHDIAIGTAQGLAYLHEESEQRIIHYDVRPANVFLDANLCPKVGNFGDAKMDKMSNNMPITNGYRRGSPGYSAPEFTLSNYPITHKCDVYSFGRVLLEMIGRKNHTSMTDFRSNHWFPENVWNAYEKGELIELVVGYGIVKEKEDRTMAIRACEVALWCIQDCFDERPPMSAVVKMLEGGVEIMPPPKPFQYSNPIQVGRINTSLQQTSNTGTSLDLSTSTIETNSRWYREITPPASS